MKKALIIIGNGFDLYHGLPTQYSCFKWFLEHIKNPVPVVPGNMDYINSESITPEEQKRINFSESLSKYIDGDLLWSEFEVALGEVDFNSIVEDAHELLNNPYDEDYRDGEYHDFTMTIEEALEFKNSISFHLNEWIEVINKQQANNKKVKIFDNECIYINFNYTNTLNRIYNISDEDILYIHGKAPSSNLIIGHDVSPTKENENDSQDYDQRFIQGELIINEYLNDTQKKCKTILENNIDFFKKLKNIENVYVLGHSIANVDLPYFNYIKSNIPLYSKWNVTYYRDNDRNQFNSQLSSIGLDSNFINFCKMDELSETN